MLLGATNKSLLNNDGEWAVQEEHEQKETDTRLKLGATEWVIGTNSISKDGAEYRHGLALIILSGLSAIQVLCRKNRRNLWAVAHKHTFKPELSKHCFCPPVPANERDTEAWDMARLITPPNRSCNWLQPKHFTLPTRSGNRSHSSEAFVVPLLSYFLFSLSQPVCHLTHDEPLDALILMCYKLFLFLTLASSSPKSLFQQATERQRHSHPLIPSPRSDDADW